MVRCQVTVEQFASKKSHD